MKFFLKNHALGEIHGWIGLAMFGVAILHIFQNWKPMQNHLRDWRVFALLIPILLVIGFFAFGQNQLGFGINPREVINKLSQADANDLAKVFGKDVNSVFASMKSDGLEIVSPNESVNRLAFQNQKPPERILIYFLK